MKIGIDIRLIGKKRTGDEAVFFNFVKNLAQIDAANNYFLYTNRDPEKDRGLAKEIRKLELRDNFKVVFINSPNRFLWNFWALPNCLRKNVVDVFHTQYIAPFWLPKNVKLILTIHDISFNFYPQLIKKGDLFFLKALIPRSLRMAAKIIAVSEFTKSEIEKYYKIPSGKIAVAYNGIDFGLFNQNLSPEKLEIIRKKYHLPEKFILYIGTLQPRKNVPVLIEALKIFYEKYNLQDVKLVIAGKRKAHNFDTRIDETIKKYNLQENIIFPGWIDEEDKPALFKLARCFVFPSLYEGFGIPIVEAMSAGTPVVCSNQEALLEVGGSAILSSNPDDANQMAENIYKALKDEGIRSDLMKRGIERAEYFSWRKNAEKTLEIYNNLAN